MKLTNVHIQGGWLDLLKRTARETVADGCLGLAAQLSFYFLLALFPALLFVVYLLGLLPSEPALANLLDRLGPVAPGHVLEFLRTELRDITARRHHSVLTFGMLVALWSSSSAVGSIINTVNRAYDIEQRRSWWKRQVLAILLTLLLAVVVVASTFLMLVGPEGARWLAAWFGVADTATATWSVVRWPLILLLGLITINLIYYVAPERDSEWVWINAGSLLAVVLWIGGSLVFKYYISTFGRFSATYGAIGGVFVLMIWFYLSGLAVLVGAELNAEMGHASRRSLEARQQKRPSEPPNTSR